MLYDTLLFRFQNTALSTSKEQCFNFKREGGMGVLVDFFPPLTKLLCVASQVDGFSDERGEYCVVCILF